VHQLPCRDLLNDPDGKACAACGRSAPQISALINLLLAIFMAFVGFVSGSKAVLGNSLYAFKDFVTSFIVVIGVKVSEKPADENHPYGHGKIEFVAMMFIGVAIFVASLFLFVHSARDVWASWTGTIRVPALFALSAGVISVIANYKLYAYLQCVGTQRNSPAILAAAKHHHSDTISSFLVVLAIIGANIGFTFLDPFVAVIETLDLMRLGYHMLRDSLKGLLDASSGDEVTATIVAVAERVPGVRRARHVNVRHLGQNRWIDLTIKVDHDKPATEGYEVSLHVKASLEKAMDNIAGVSVAVEPYLP
jgi:cation diffusion facilitator family transporter